ncbi:hypothetical protein FEF65_09570 [Mariprofundus erugo]|uniref:Tetratricopeptide repeat protein n=1 Tax=Mariprofundus erugo TaxID=2528639 RepID=A0A5R9GPB9_9PROT|nr:hypothetical protein [Mariprofundus erugo]TLS66759.1 hypothetical protein FEF65_09570 [Mariprofundus erugo]
MIKRAAVYLFAVVATLLLGWQISLSLDSAKAFSYEHRVYMSFQSWYASHQMPGEEEWQAQEALILRAIALQGRNASIKNTAGRLYEYRAYQFSPQSTALRMQYAEKAAAMYRLATHDSPMLVYPWMNLALIKMKLGQWDQEFFQAYRKAVMLGPWELAAMPVLVEIGLLVYPNMDGVSRQFISAYIDRVADGAGPMVGGQLHNKPAMCWRLQQMGHPKAYERICGT